MSEQHYFVRSKGICKRGVPEAVTQLTTPATAFCYNLMLARLIGDLGVSTFSILSFIYSLANAILSGVAQGLQPLYRLCRQDKSFPLGRRIAD